MSSSASRSAAAAGEPARAADQQRLLPGQPPGGEEGVAVADRDDPVGHAAVVGLRPEVLADPLDQVRAPGAAGVDRALGVGADHLHAPAGDLLEVATGPADRPAGADPGHEVRDPAVGLRPDLRAGARVVGGRVLRVAVLVGLPGPGDLLRQPGGHRVVAVGVLGRDGTGADDDLRAVRPEHVDLLGAHLVRHDEHALVAAGVRDQREPDAGVAAGRLDDGAAGLQGAGPLGLFDHGQRDPVLHRPAGVQVFHLGDHLRSQVRGHPGQPDERGVADHVDQRVVNLHGTSW